VDRLAVTAAGGRPVIRYQPLPSNDGEEAAEPLAAEIDQAAFREVLSHFCTGVVVVTGLLDDEPVGMTCQSFSSVSLDPPLVMFCPAKASTTWPSLRRAGRFAVNVLSAYQAQISRDFAVSGGRKFDGKTWQPGITGAPLIVDAIAYVECIVAQVYDAGDHEIVLGRVVALERSTANAMPLLFFRSRYLFSPSGFESPRAN
jgi:3-hydroxy-9,10-secoandrosta-1,3,5(10)-triene-9,17-dione monooxygenase reductase component